MPPWYIGPGLSGAHIDVIRRWIQGGAPGPTLPDRFDRNDAGNLAESRPNNDVPARAVPIGTAPGPTWVAELPSGGPRTHRITVGSLTFHTSGDQDWFVIRSFPAGPGSGLCRSRLDVSLAGVQVEVTNLDGSSPRVLARVAGSPGTDPLGPLGTIERPLQPLMLKITRPPGIRTTDYLLQLRFIEALTGSVCALDPGAF